MPKIQSNGRFALRRRVNQLLAERGADVRIAEARGAPQREMLGDYFLVGYPDRHVIARDHVVSMSSHARLAHWRPGLVDP
jgi:hypothetical protein